MRSSIGAGTPVTASKPVMTTGRVRLRLWLGVVLLAAGIVCAALAYPERHDVRSTYVNSGLRSCGSVSHPDSKTSNTEDCHDLLADRKTTSLREVVGAAILLTVGGSLVVQAAARLSGFESEAERDASRG